ncbi:MAG: 50S ribosomal protein L11 methyltransferase [Gammaproteobacteria bacterium]|nr:50S ribosomal protein L11 methyltransferase [Gammaproteobacteria bacterium]
MTWLQLSLEATPDNATLISDLLDELGAAAVTLQDLGDDPVYEPPVGSETYWRHIRVTALFDGAADISAVADQLCSGLEVSELLGFSVAALDDDDWVNKWKADFKPMHFGADLWICPRWSKPPRSGAINIFLDPGLAFGTGTHPTTALCLQWLARADVEGHDVIDYGCGSGVLAIAALMLGAKHVWAVDHDPQALLATQDNARQNGVDGCLTVCLPEQLSVTRCDLLLANILSGPLIELAPRFATLLPAHGRLILSGLLTEQAAPVKEVYDKQFEQLSVVSNAGWIRLEGLRKAH